MLYEESDLGYLIESGKWVLGFGLWACAFGCVRSATASFL
jgi:hypothetical protein